MNDVNRVLQELLDLHGADLNAWPDQEAAHKAREAALSDPVFRQQLDMARRLDKAIAALSSAVDDSPLVETRLANLRASTLAQIEPQAQRRRVFSSRTLMRLAASLVLACGIGIGVGQIVPDPADSPPNALDQLLLGAYQPSADDGEG